MEKFTFFWSGPFSQWEPSEFVKDVIKYNCAEQYMMHQKALLFGDTVIADKIMETTDPSEQKKYGRMVNLFDIDEWNSMAQEIVYEGSYAKFTQNKHLYEYLMNTAGTTLVEASPHDKIWGIGLKEADPRAQDRLQWLGTNWLGQILTELREDLIISNFELEAEWAKYDATVESEKSRRVEAHIRKHITIRDGKAHIEETLVPERNMMPIEEYAQIYAEKMKIELAEGVRIIHPDDYQCYELQSGKWVIITIDN